MKREYIKNKGITLIALVVTIIVTLILAGISIAALTGENGLINSAYKAKKQSEISEEKETLQNAINYAAGYNKSGILEIEELKKSVQDNTEGTPGDETSFPLSVTFSDTGNVYIIDGNGNCNESELITGRLSNIITTEDYGKNTDYSVEINGTTLDNWKIFYKDNGKVYLIYGGYLEANLMPSHYRAKTNTSTYPYSVWPANNLYNFHNEYIKNSSLWQAFAAGCEGAVAVGSPSMDELALSYGHQLWSSGYGITSTISGDLYVNSSLDVGYWLNEYHSSHSSDWLYRVEKTGKVYQGPDGGWSQRIFT